ncbi:unnamed protein product [Pleuronectes platessa]|uniref:Uncharacterized protein n=1 Tax=Pleuronectes platessa TaxID=8262 RepID=A0A9N7Y5Y2_PLEPL|nr:unnamed protein product [Pleuronectes platessa]
MAVWKRLMWELLPGSPANTTRGSFLSARAGDSFKCTTVKTYISRPPQLPDPSCDTVSVSRSSSSATPLTFAFGHGVMLLFSIPTLSAPLRVLEESLTESGAFSSQHAVSYRFNFLPPREHATASAWFISSPGTGQTCERLRVVFLDMSRGETSNTSDRDIFSLLTSSSELGHLLADSSLMGYEYKPEVDQEEEGVQRDGREEEEGGRGGSPERQEGGRGGRKRRAGGRGRKRRDSRETGGRKRREEEEGGRKREEEEGVQRDGRREEEETGGRKKREEEEDRPEHEDFYNLFLKKSWTTCHPVWDNSPACNTQTAPRSPLDPRCPSRQVTLPFYQSGAASGTQSNERRRGPRPQCC